MATRNAIRRVTALAAVGAWALVLAGCGNDSVSRFTGGTSSKDKQDIPPAVQAGAAQAGAPAPAAGGVVAPAGVEGPAVATKAPETEVAGKDEPIRESAWMYRAGSGRDPFRSLVSDGDNRSELVDLSVVTLVGVVNGGGIPFCIVEDAEGVSYVLRKGDRVKNGRVVGIHTDALVASQTILGYTTTVQLKLHDGKDVKNG